MKQFWRSLWPLALVEWHEPKEYKRTVQHQYRRQHPLHWFLFTLSLPFAGGVLLMCFPWLVAHLQQRTLVPSAPLTFLVSGTVIGLGLAVSSLFLSSTPATIRCFTDRLIIVRGLGVERWNYDDFAWYRLTTKSIGREQYRILTLITKYHHHISIGVPYHLDLSGFMSQLLQSKVIEQRVQTAE